MGRQQQDSSGTFIKVLEKNEKYCIPQKCNQESGEPVKSVVTELMLKAKTCEFQIFRHNLIRDHIVSGIISKRVRERLLLKNDLTLQKAMQICQAAEATERQLN